MVDENSVRISHGYAAMPIKRGYKNTKNDDNLYSYVQSKQKCLCMCYAAE